MNCAAAHLTPDARFARNRDVLAPAEVIVLGEGGPRRSSVCAAVGLEQALSRVTSGLSPRLNRMLNQGLSLLLNPTLSPDLSSVLN